MKKESSNGRHLLNVTKDLKKEIIERRVADVDKFIKDEDNV